MSKVAISSNEPVVTITVPVRLLPQLMAAFAVAGTPVPAPRVYETTAEDAPASHVGVVKTLPLASQLRRVG